MIDPDPTVLSDDQRIVDRSFDHWLGAHGRELIDLRQWLHANPETSGEELATTQHLAEQLEKLGLSPRVLADGTGLVCDVVGRDADGPTVALRADIDALPLQDEKDVPYRSRRDGVVHACGHDVHATIVLGAGWALSEALHERDIEGRVRLIFQSAEERMPGGAQEVIDQGGLDGVRCILGLHCDPTVEVGRIGLRSGAITSAADRFRVELTGPGGHTARPGETVDLVAAAARLATELPALVARELDSESVTLVFGRLSAGEVANAIPTHAVLEGTVRTPEPQVWQRTVEVVPPAIRAIVEPTGAGVTIDYTRGVPAIINDEAVTTMISAVAVKTLGPRAVVEASQSFGADDFAWYLQQVPGTYLRLGTTTPGTTPAHDLHAGAFDVDESCIAVGVRLLTAAALEALRS
jgi:amidohydrolase